MAWSDGNGQYLGQEYGGFYPDETQDVALFGSSESKGGAGGGLLLDTAGLNQQTQNLGSNATTGLLNNTATGINNQNSANMTNAISTGAGLLLDGSSAGGSTLGAVGNGIGAVAGSYSNASTDTGSSVMSGVASGAAAGAAFGPWGAVIGGVIGGIAGFFGSKSKKNKEKKAFQQQEQLAVLPYQQQQANWLQKEGLMQKAIGNYASGYTPGGFQFKNNLFNRPYTGATPGPVAPGNLPNFNVAPPNVVPGSGDSSLGIAPQSLPNSGRQQPALVAPTAPAYSSNKAANSSNLAQYQKQYMDYINQSRQQMMDNSMQPYANIPYGG